MSSRRSLYRSNRSHTSLYGPRTDTTVTHWQLDSVTINTTRDEDAPADTPQKTHTFQVKTWVQLQADAYTPIDDGVEDDTLPFIKHSYNEDGLIGGYGTPEPPADTPGKSGGSSMGFIPTEPVAASVKSTPSASETPAATDTPAEGVTAEATSAEGTFTTPTPASATPVSATPANEPSPETASAAEDTAVTTELNGDTPGETAPVNDGAEAAAAAVPADSADVPMPDVS